MISLLFVQKRWEDDHHCLTRVMENAYHFFTQVMAKCLPFTWKRWGDAFHSHRRDGDIIPIA